MCDSSRSGPDLAVNTVWNQLAWLASSWMRTSLLWPVLLLFIFPCIYNALQFKSTCFQRLHCIDWEKPITNWKCTCCGTCCLFVRVPFFTHMYIVFRMYTTNRLAFNWGSAMFLFLFSDTVKPSLFIQLTSAISELIESYLFILTLAVYIQKWVNY